MAECENAAKQIAESKGAPNCPAHEPLSHGVSLLLRMGIAQMESTGESKRIARTTALWVAGVVAGLGMILGQGDKVLAFVRVILGG